MEMKHILLLFGVAVLIGWFMPTSDPVAETSSAAPIVHTVPNPRPVATVAPVTTAPAPMQTPFARVVLQREGNGHFFAQGEADGAAVRFMVDTGASVIALTAADAQKLGQTWYPNELQMVGRGVNGDVIGKPIMLNRVRIGNIEATNVRAIIVPEGLDVSLLGQSFLKQVSNVNISGDQMTLG
jgi:aspartyl protease family protein